MKQEGIKLDGNLTESQKQMLEATLESEDYAACEREALRLGDGLAAGD